MSHQAMRHRHVHAPVFCVWKGGEMNMPEVSFSMANLKFAVDIKPADISPAPSAPERLSSAGDGRSEDFGSTLARASEPAGRKATETSAKAGTVGRRDDSQKSSPEKKSRKSSDSPAGGAATTSQKAPSRSVKGGNEASKATASESKSQAVTETASTGATAQNGNAVGSSETSNAVSTPTVVAGSTMGAYTTGLLIDELADVLGPEVDAAATVDSPADSVASDNTARPGAQFAVSVDRRLVLDVPLLNTSEDPGDAPIVQTATLTPANGSAEQTAHPEQYDLVSSARPRAEFAAARSSEWTEILEFTRLLNPSIEREAVTDQRPSQQTVQAQAWRPDARPTPEGSRDSWQPRFSEPAIESGRTVVDSRIWTVDPATAVAGNRMATEPLTLARSQLRMPLEAAPLTSETVAAVDSTGGVTVGSRPIVNAQGTSARIEIQPENLVSDVREAVMRIAADGRGEARITLHPPELGELVVRLESARNGVMRAEFHTMSPLVREALEAGLTRLTQALESEGLTLEQASVYLSFNLGAEGNAGESEPGYADGTTALGAVEETLVSETGEESATTVERLPEGATISILA
jgi:flagellar hook-length control protein FliK